MKKQATKQPTKAKATKAPKATKTTPKTAAPKPNKTETVISLLQRESGADLAELMKVTGWQKHSVRGFISGTLKKKHGLTITREGTTYRITK